MAYLFPSPMFEPLRRDGYVYVAGPSTGWVTQVRTVRVDAVRSEARRRGAARVEWWLGWSAPREAAPALLDAGLVRDDVPTLAAMTCSAEPPGAPDVEVRRVRTAAEYAAAVAVDWEVWQLSEAERKQRREGELDRFEEIAASGSVHHFAALIDGRFVGFGRAVDMHGGVALMGGAVLPESRGRGVYRALVRARWEHAAARGTPLLVVQAGPISAPVLDRLGFRRHGDVHLYADPRVGSRHGNDREQD
jgi:GNAT superfamily N-acetyltransferase